ncbi:hypothetical protein N6H18_13220 [Reichenbachiella agarivorans]|uniref:LVIVD repeat-containing protein n=1 Tax=Reichenbachiella agarivorans TaxID=2979464 RepID=A0ABY6CLP7_9BACT|nr:hypothetical protein [Reichenbachiella agarivorans]UXP31309.1 hypothetical protein N6H18_13220 [Reichenbachiella agarivorans]
MKQSFTRIRGQVFYCSLLSLFFIACAEEFDPPTFDVEQIEGYQPIYDVEQLEIDLTDPIDYVAPRNVIKYQNFLFISELAGGFHVLNNTNPASPVKIGFFSIPSNENIAAKGNVIYADSGPHLLAMSIEQDGSIDVRRLENVFQYGKRRNREFDLTIVPPKSGYYFDCVEDEKGAVVGWKKVILNNPQCYF